MWGAVTGIESPLIAPTLRARMQPGTLRVPVTQSVGAIKRGGVAQTAIGAVIGAWCW